MNELSNAERETHLNLVADDRSTWIVYSDDPVMIRKLDRIGAKLVKAEGFGKHFELDAKQVLLRKAPQKRNLTDEQKAELRERLAKSRGCSAAGVLETQNGR